MMKLDIVKIKNLMNAQIFNLVEDELKSIAFLLDIEILEYKRYTGHVCFKMKHMDCVVHVQHFNKSWCSFLKTSVKEKVNVSSKIRQCYGGCYSFAGAVLIFRNFYLLKRYQLTIQSPESQNFYTRQEWKDAVLAAEGEIRTSIFGKKK